MGTGTSHEPQQTSHELEDYSNNRRQRYNPSLERSSQVHFTPVLLSQERPTLGSGSQQYASTPAPGWGGNQGARLPQHFQIPGLNAPDQDAYKWIIYQCSLVSGGEKFWLPLPGSSFFNCEGFAIQLKRWSQGASHKTFTNAIEAQTFILSSPMYSHFLEPAPASGSSSVYFWYRREDDGASITYHWAREIPMIGNHMLAAKQGKEERLWFYSSFEQLKQHVEEVYKIPRDFDIAFFKLKNG